MSHSRHNSIDDQQNTALLPPDEDLEYRHILKTLINQPIDVILRCLIEEHAPRKTSPAQQETLETHSTNDLLRYHRHNSSPSDSRDCPATPLSLEGDSEELSRSSNQQTSWMPWERERDMLDRYQYVVGSIIPITLPQEERAYFQRRAERIARRELLKSKPPVLWPHHTKLFSLNGLRPPTPSPLLHSNTMTLFTTTARSAPSTPLTTSSPTQSADEVFELSDNMGKQLPN